MRVLLVRLSSFGDIVFTLPAAKALKEGLPGTSLAWVVEEPFAPLIFGAPYVDHVLTASTRRWRRAPLAAETRRELRAFAGAARAFAPDLVVDAQGLFKSALVTLLVPAGRRLGFGPRTAKERLSCAVPDAWVEARDRPHVADRALALAERVTGRAPLSRLPDVRHLVERPAPEVDAWWAARGGAPFALAQPFASTPEKEWDAAGLLAFAGLMRGAGLDTIVRWGPGEHERAEALERSSSGLLALAPPTDPAATARLASRAALFVGSDTGPTHLAAAAGTPTLALFGPTDPARFGPLGPRTAVLRASAGDYNRRGSPLASLPPDDIAAAALRLLA